MRESPTTAGKSKHSFIILLKQFACIGPFFFLCHVYHRLFLYTHSRKKGEKKISCRHGCLIIPAALYIELYILYSTGWIYV